MTDIIDGLNPFPLDMSPEAMLDYQRLMEERAAQGLKSGTFYVLSTGPGTFNPPLLQWVCEQHPSQPWPHDDCTGPGMPPQE